MLGGTKKWVETQRNVGLLHGGGGQTAGGEPRFHGRRTTQAEGATDLISEQGGKESQKGQVRHTANKHAGYVWGLGGRVTRGANQVKKKKSYNIEERGGSQERGGGRLGRFGQLEKRLKQLWGKYVSFTRKYSPRTGDSPDGAAGRKWVEDSWRANGKLKLVKIYTQNDRARNHALT